MHVCAGVFLYVVTCGKTDAVMRMAFTVVSNFFVFFFEMHSLSEPRVS